MNSREPAECSRPRLWAIRAISSFSTFASAGDQPAAAAKTTEAFNYVDTVKRLLGETP